MDEWLHLTASMLARMAHNVALVTPPHASSCRFRHIELVGLQGLLAMAVLIVRQAKVKQQLLPLKQATSQTELSRLAEHLNSVFHDLTRLEISHSLERGLAQVGQGYGMGGEVVAGGASPLLEQVTGAVVRMMEKEDMETEESWYLEGLNLMLEQPEFAQGQRMRSVMEVVGERRVLRESVQQALTERGVKVIIGGENEVERMRDYSLVVTGYGVAGEASGILGVLGPTRMRYGRVIATVSYLSLLLSHLLADVYGKEKQDIDVDGIH
ncbi:MAG: heat-inducible transcription repressor HrcA [Dehalococcoidia bacterium]|nr:heat-inducible transcription repressor HrcA [Dehalococcoidia bacterium]